MAPHPASEDRQPSQFSPGVVTPAAADERCRAFAQRQRETDTETPDLTLDCPVQMYSECGKLFKNNGVCLSCLAFSLHTYCQLLRYDVVQEWQFGTNPAIAAQYRHKTTRPKLMITKTYLLIYVGAKLLVVINYVQSTPSGYSQESKTARRRPPS